MAEKQAADVAADAPRQGSVNEMVSGGMSSEDDAAVLAKVRT